MDENYMQMAINLAKIGEGRVSPNPLVGAVIVKDNVIIGSGYHEKCGQAHAEINAIDNSTEDVQGSTLYVNLEPCCHFGKTPPCCDAIINRKIKKVVIGMLDPNPLVAGKGMKKLIANGIDVKLGVLEKESKELNEIFINYITTNLPFVIMKSAMSLDGKIATHSGESKWISNENSRNDVQSLRNKVTGIMVGIGTVLKDNPSLTCRIENGINPIRIIVDSNLRIPMDSEIIKTSHKVKTIIVTTKKAPIDKMKIIENMGAKILIVTDKDDKVDLKELMNVLGKLKIDSILLEGGGNLNFSALNENVVNKVIFYIAPIIIGGQNSKTPVEGVGINVLKDAFKLHDMTVSNVNCNIIVKAYLKRGDY